MNEHHRSSLREFGFLSLIIVVMGIVLLSYNVVWGTVTLLLYLVSLAIKGRLDREEIERTEEEYQAITREVARINRDKMYGLPVPMAVIGEDGRLLIPNNAFIHAFGKDVGQKGVNLIETMALDLKDDVDGTVHEVDFQEKTFGMLVSGFTKGNRQLYLLHFVDITEQKKLEKKYRHSETVFAYVLIDNYDDILEQVAASERSVLFGRIDVIMTNWANRNGAVLIKYDNDRYVVTLARDNMRIMEECHFRILDEVRDAGMEVNTAVTLSIGVGISEKPMTLQESDELSRAALDIALARGGDQCVVRKDDNNTYYGGKTEAKEKRTKVKARVKAHGLRELIRDAENVVIMGHQTPDMDCLGSAVGLMGACRCMGKEARYILKENNAAIHSLMDYLGQDPNYTHNFLMPKEAEDFIGDGTLLVVVDTQNLRYVEMPEMVERLNNIVIIDHHRSPGQVIKGTVFNYVEAYASSTCELVAELLQYFDYKDIIGVTEANALLAGMCMDTKMFTVKTGVRTFEAASYLKRKGADTIIAKTLLQNDIETYAAKSEAVTNAEFYDNTIAISLYENRTKNAKLIAAQAADELLNIKGINASFIVLKTENGIFISGRSMGEINVQLILEKLGGGGHMTIAGAQMYDTNDLQVARDRLIEAIDTYKKESE